MLAYLDRILRRYRRRVRAPSPALHLGAAVFVLSQIAGCSGCLDGCIDLGGSSGGGCGSLDFGDGGLFGFGGGVGFGPASSVQSGSGGAGGHEATSFLSQTILITSD